MFRFEEHKGKLTPGAITIGGYPKLAGKFMGSSLTNSVIENNQFIGKVSKHGVFLMPGGKGFENASTGNRIDVGDSLISLGAETTVTLSQEMANNSFRGKYDTISDSASESSNKFNRNKY